MPDRSALGIDLGVRAFLLRVGGRFYWVSGERSDAAALLVFLGSGAISFWAELYWKSMTGSRINTRGHICRSRPRLGWNQSVETISFIVFVSDGSKEAS